MSHKATSNWLVDFLDKVTFICFPKERAFRIDSSFGIKDCTLSSACSGNRKSVWIVQSDITFDWHIDYWIYCTIFLWRRNCLWKNRIVHEGTESSLLLSYLHTYLGSKIINISGILFSTIGIDTVNWFSDKISSIYSTIFFHASK